MGYFWGSVRVGNVYGCYFLEPQLAIFLFSVAIGVISSIMDPNFARTILGDSYVRMTETYIESGDPMAVYKSSYEIDMFLRITLNNLRVAFLTFVLGIFFSIGAVAILLINGIMVGTFQYFFIERSLFWESFSTIWLHGTLEISSIIIAGGAGIVLGKGLVFPGTYSRLTAFRLSARRGLKLILGISPIIVFAALIESFITRYNDVPDVLKLGVIAFSAIVILSYFVWYPYLKSKSGFKYSDTEQRLFNRNRKKITFEGKIKTINELFGDTLFLFSKIFKRYFRLVLLIVVIYTPLTFFLIQEDLFEFTLGDNFFLGRLFPYLDYHRFNFLYIFNTLATALSVIFTIRMLAQKAGHSSHFHPGHWAQVIVLMGIFHLLFFLPLFFLFMGIFLLLPFLFLQAYISYVERMNIGKALLRLTKLVKS
ncbi:MAG: stage II sporulation protein M, partial [Bacteroidota bacterium]